MDENNSGRRSQRKTRVEARSARKQTSGKSQVESKKKHRHNSKSGKGRSKEETVGGVGGGGGGVGGGCYDLFLVGSFGGCGGFWFGVCGLFKGLRGLCLLAMRIFAFCLPRRQPSGGSKSTARISPQSYSRSGGKTKAHALKDNARANSGCEGPHWTQLKTKSCNDDTSQTSAGEGPYRPAKDYSLTVARRRAGKKSPRKNTLPVLLKKKRRTEA